jgi:uncharacterized protein (DUF433 family)
MVAADLVTTDPDILGGTAVFRGTRVPVRTFFEYLENNYSLDEFLECFPSVSREAATRLLELSQHALLSAAAGGFSSTSVSRGRSISFFPGISARLPSAKVGAVSRMEI